MIKKVTLGSLLVSITACGGSGGGSTTTNTDPNNQNMTRDEATVEIARQYGQLPGDYSAASTVTIGGESIELGGSLTTNPSLANSTFVGYVFDENLNAAQKAAIETFNTSNLKVRDHPLAYIISLTSGDTNPRGIDYAATTLSKINFDNTLEVELFGDSGNIIETGDILYDASGSNLGTSLGGDLEGFFYTQNPANEVTSLSIEDGSGTSYGSLGVSTTLGGDIVVADTSQNFSTLGNGSYSLVTEVNGEKIVIGTLDKIVGNFECPVPTTYDVPLDSCRL